MIHNFMNSLLKALYEILSFITEDAVAHGLGDVPKSIHEKMNSLCNELGDYLDSID